MNSRPGVVTPRRIRLGLVGSADEGRSGALHCAAARLQDRYDLVAFTSGGSRAVAAPQRPPAERRYADHREMARLEAQRPDGIDIVAIATAEHLHGRIAAVFLDAGIDVICDPPMAPTLAEAMELVTRVRRGGRLLALTQDYRGHAMLRHARGLVGSGELGELRLVQVDYPLPAAGETVRSGGRRAAASGDVSSHAEHLARFVSGLELTAVSADLHGHSAAGAHRVILRYGDRVRGLLRPHPGPLRLQVHGTAGGLYFHQDRPDRLWVKPAGQPPRLITRLEPGAGPSLSHGARLQHKVPQDQLDGYAQLYRDVAEQIHARWQGRPPDPRACWVPTVEDGASGLRFIEAVIESGRAGGRWVDARLVV